jgi:Fe-S cluster assembly iron-binding protein IscA
MGQALVSRFDKILLFSYSQKTCYLLYKGNIRQIKFCYDQNIYCFTKEKGRSIPLKIKMGEPKVEIIVSDIALETVKKLLETDKNKKGIYVYLAGVGCGGGGTASYSLAPVEQEEGENVVIIDGIPFIYDNLMLKHTDKISIDYKPSAYGNEIWLEQFRVKPV